MPIHMGSARLSKCHGNAERLTVTRRHRFTSRPCHAQLVCQCLAHIMYISHIEVPICASVGSILFVLYLAVLCGQTGRGRCDGECVYHSTSRCRCFSQPETRFVRNVMQCPPTAGRISEVQDLYLAQYQRKHQLARKSGVSFLNRPRGSKQLQDIWLVRMKTSHTHTAMVS